MDERIEYIVGEIVIGFVAGRFDGRREIRDCVMNVATFSNTPFTDDHVAIQIDLLGFKDERGRTICDVLAERGSDVFKIIDSTDQI